MRIAPAPAQPPMPRVARAVPEGRTRRFLHMGMAVGEMAFGAAGEGLSRAARGEALDLQSLLLAPANARRLAERLSTLRGAVMKLGQLLSMEGQGVLPPAFAELLAGLRERAHIMPATQLSDVLEREYGADWHRRFRRFSFEPIAAASIGQVHRAETLDGQLLAVKIQYPGVRASIGSDLANLGWLARLPGLAPAGATRDLAPLLAQVRDQLLHETDYTAEAVLASDYRARLGEDPMLHVPAVHAEHSTATILAMDFAAGEPIDRLAAGSASQALRDQVATALCRLAVREVFEMGLVQTDPNFGNYLFDATSGRIVLLDFGATQQVTPERVEQLRALGQAMRLQDPARTLDAARALGLIDEPAGVAPGPESQAVLAMIGALGEPLRHVGRYDFGRSDLIRRVFGLGQAQWQAEGFGSPPPPDLLWLQRKFAGTFLLCARLRARVDVEAVFAGYL